MSEKLGELFSMTGFGHSQIEHNGFGVTIELSSLNHRYFDLNFYAPPGLMKFEPLLRQRVHRTIRRGRIRLCLHLTGATEPGQRLKFCEENVNEYLAARARIEEMIGADCVIDPAALLTAPYVLVPSREDFDTETWQSVLEKLVDDSLGKLLEMRREEGERLAIDLVERTAAMLAILERIEARAPDVKREYHDRILERVREWRLDVKMPEERLQTELILFCERSDITEEIVRLKSHLQQFEESLRQGGQVGRRLVFIAQEVNREATTIGAKSNDTKIGRDVVLFKEQLAKVREQIENLE